MNWIHRAQFLITRIWIFYHSESDHACLDHLSRDWLAQRTALEYKRFHFPSLSTALRNLWLFLVFNYRSSLYAIFIFISKIKVLSWGKKEEKNEKAYSTKLCQNRLRQCDLCQKDSLRKSGCPFYSVQKSQIYSMIHCDQTVKQTNDDSICYAGTVLAELVYSVAWRNQNDSDDSLFRFSELSRLHASRLKQRRLIFHSKRTAQILNT